VRQDPDTRAAERDALGQYLDYQRETILLKTEGLTKDQLAQKIPTSDLTLAGLLYHLALVEESWLEGRFLGMPDRQDWVDVDWVADPNWEFRTATTMEPGTLRQRYRDACERSRQAAAAMRTAAYPHRSANPVHGASAFCAFCAPPHRAAPAFEGR